MNCAIGIDLGGTHVAAAIVSEDGSVGFRCSRRLQSYEVDHVVAQIAAAIDEARHELGEQCQASIGVASPGNIDERTGAVRFSPNFFWRDVPLRALVENRVGAEISILNDARCATLGEHTYGSGRGTRDFVLITLGTGIGGGIVANGRLVLGHMMGAGEVGHHQIRPDTGFRCTCGKIGCFEVQASARGLLRHAIALKPSFPSSTLLPDKPLEELDAEPVVRAAQAGEPLAARAWQNYLADLAIGVANIIAFTNPEVIALGGGLGQTDENLLAKPLTKAVDDLTTMVPAGTTRIVSATLGNDAGAVGAAALVFAGGIRALATRSAHSTK